MYIKKQFWEEFAKQKKNRNKFVKFLKSTEVFLATCFQTMFPGKTISARNKIF